MAFFIDNVVTLWSEVLWSELASLLLDRGMIGIDLEPVYCYVWVDSSHVLVGPSKAIVVLLEELD